ncbi:putative leader peptide [Streptomyces sp. NBC_01476]|uniref:putative leader peptide n=1 Tax=Streptomyces sp. NBC_01476 TaxID=2903881 RepID=UPI003FCCAE68
MRAVAPRMADFPPPGKPRRERERLTRRPAPPVVAAGRRCSRRDAVAGPAGGRSRLSRTGVRAGRLRASPEAGDVPAPKRTAPLMPYRPTAAGATAPAPVAVTRCAPLSAPRFAARRHIDLHRVSSAICRP